MCVGLLGTWRFSANATTLAYEGFDYAPGTTIAGQAGGALWAGAWASGSTGNMLGTNNASGLTYADATGRLLLTSGGSLVVGVSNSPSAFTATPNRSLSTNLSGGTGTTPGAGRTVWLSFLYQRLNLETGGAPYFRQANLGLFEGSSERLAVGGPNTSATVSNVFSVWAFGAAHSSTAPFQSAQHPLLPGDTTCVVIKVVTDGTSAPDSAYVWFNPTNLTLVPDDATADVTDHEVNLSGVNTLRFHAAGYNVNGTNAAFQVDEVRVGTTFADVTPNAANAESPTILADPQNLTVIEGQPASFTVAASGDAPLHYQWHFNTNTVLPDATNSTYSIDATVPGDSGAYSVIVTNASGSATSAVATLTVEAPIPPEIISQPQSLTNVVGSNAVFSVMATGSAPLRYQWYYNSISPLMDRTNATLDFVIASTNASGGYSVIVTNSYGARTSEVAQLTAVLPPDAYLPAFPGADGAARFVRGGRGGVVYHVTTLDRNMDHSELGTLRYGLTDANFPPGVPRTIVFDVAGTFWLGRFGAESNHFHGWDTASRYNFSGNTTIAGQTAPGPVIIAGGVSKPGASNIIVRNLTLAPSYGMRSFEDPPLIPPTPGDFPDSFVFDALDVSGQNVMLDHLTCIYGTDETISANEEAANLTIQYCTMAQGENYPQADAENPGVYTGHALGSLLQAGENARISVIHNFYAHLKSRIPAVGSEVGSGALNDFRNNVVYNWLSWAGYGGSTLPSFNNFINNFYLAGDGGDDVSDTNIVSVPGQTAIFHGGSATNTRAYVAGNLKDVQIDADPADTTSADTDYFAIAPQAAAYDINIGVTLAPSHAFTNALRYCGARWWERDYDIALGNIGAIDNVDERLAHEAVTGTGKVVAWADDPFNDDPNEGVEWRNLLALRADPVTGAAPFNHPAGWDTDQDGMPDTWEIEHGLDPNVANNNGDFDNDLYTDLEEYLNDTAAWPAPGVIAFTGATNSRYALIHNWRVTGVPVNISGISNLPTWSPWQPSRYDTAVISNGTVVVDAVGQHARTLNLLNGAELNITNGWLKAASLEIGAGCALNVAPGGALRLAGSGSISMGAGATFTNGGVLDIISWEGTLPAELLNTGTVLDRSSIRVDSAHVAGEDFKVNLQGYRGHGYQLQVRNNAASGVWQDIGGRVCGTDAQITLSDTGGASNQQRFYRVAVD